MNTKNDVEVVINGKQYTLCGYESNEYLQQIASHINEKFSDLKRQEGYNRLDADMKNILLAINLSDDYYKAQEQARELLQQKGDMEKEIFDMKHELINGQTRIEELEADLENSRKEYEKVRHQVIRLEAQLGNSQDEVLEAAAVREKPSSKRNRKRAESSSAELQLDKRK